jgi:hypothetical protein
MVSGFTFKSLICLELICIIGEREGVYLFSFAYGYPIFPIPFIERTVLAGHLWLIPVILATWEADIRRITVQGQFWQIVGKIPSPK